MFLQVSVILFTGGVPGAREGAWSRWGGGAWSWGVPGPRGVSGRGEEGLVLGGAWSWGVPGGDAPPDGYCCGWYASYWNAFLLFY